MRFSTSTFALCVLMLSVVALAAPSKKELQQRAEARYPQIRELKSAGTVGETSDGLLDLVKPDASAQKIVDEENIDRKALYALIAKETNVTADIVAQQAGARNLAKAHKGEFIKENGKWRQK